MQKRIAGWMIVTLIALGALLSGCTADPGDLPDTGTGKTTEEAETTFRTETSAVAEPERQSGSFRSNTGTGLNLRVEWNTEKTAGREIRLTLRIFLEHYSLSVGERSGAYAGSIRVQGAPERAFSTPAIRTSQNEFRSDLLTAEDYLISPDAYEDGTISVTVTWRFGGTYAGKEIDSVTARGLILFS